MSVLYVMVLGLIPWLSISESRIWTLSNAKTCKQDLMRMEYVWTSGWQPSVIFILLSRENAWSKRPLLLYAEMRAVYDSWFMTQPSSTMTWKSAWAFSGCLHFPSMIMSLIYMPVLGLYQSCSRSSSNT